MTRKVNCKCDNNSLDLCCMLLYIYIYDIMQVISLLSDADNHVGTMRAIN